MAEWEQIRIQAGSRVFAALYQGRPSPDAGNVWQRQWWRRYHEPLWSQHPDYPDAYLVNECDEVVISWDMAFKDTKSRDYVASQVWSPGAARTCTCSTRCASGCRFTDTLDRVRSPWWRAGRRRPRKYVEDKANGPAVISTLKSKIPGIVPVNPKDSKYGRATASPRSSRPGNVLLPDPDIALFDAEELIDEAAGFPNAAHDDLVDATSQALAELLLDGNGAQAWIAWAKRKAEEAAAGHPPEPRLNGHVNGHQPAPPAPDDRNRPPAPIR